MYLQGPMTALPAATLRLLLQLHREDQEHTPISGAMAQRCAQLQLEQELIM